MQCLITRGLLIYDAVIGSKALYSLETINLTQLLRKKLDAFHLRGLRRILKVKPFSQELDERRADYDGDPFQNNNILQAARQRVV